MMIIPSNVGLPDDSAGSGENHPQPDNVISIAKANVAAHRLNARKWRDLSLDRGSQR